MSYDRFDVILVLFPFTEKKGSKQRPAIVLSARGFNETHQHAIVAMVTTAGTTSWPSDVTIEHYADAGLRSPCVVRAKLFTISFDLVPGKVGSLAAADAQNIADWAGQILPSRTGVQ